MYSIVHKRRYLAWSDAKLAWRTGKYLGLGGALGGTLLVLVLKLDIQADILY